MVALANDAFRRHTLEIYLNTPLEQHQLELSRNKKAWREKPLLQKVYRGCYDKVAQLVDLSIPGKIIEVGSGMGLLKERFPSAICSDLFCNDWLDLACDAYELPFSRGSISHLIAFDVFHHLEWPRAFLKESKRVLAPGGRLILFEPYVSLLSLFAYGLFHHEPLALSKPISLARTAPRQRQYYAAQGNLTRLLHQPEFFQEWEIFHNEPMASFAYLLSGGFSKPSMYPHALAGTLTRLDSRFSKWPRLFGARCLLGASPLRA